MDRHDPVRRAAARFRTRFGIEPDAVASAPGRVNLLGEHVDHRGGVVVPFAIDRRIAVAVSPASDGRTTIVGDDLGIEASWPGPPPTAPITDGETAFANHVLGVVAGLDPDGPSPPPLSITIAGDLPVGGGLSSSAALEVAAAIAVTAAFDRPMPDVPTLVRVARDAEHHWVGTPCGVMDMLASAAGRADRILRIDCHTLETAAIPVPWTDELAVMLLDSGVRHRLADGGYAARLAALDRVESGLDRPLRTTTLADLDAATTLDPTDRRRARHVVTEMTRVSAMIDALRDADLETIGDLMFAGHESLRHDFEVSIPELDRLVDSARGLRHRGVIGARLTGGGFGGRVVMLARRARLDEVLAEIDAAFESRFGRGVPAIEVRPSEGARLEATSSRPVSYPRGRPDA